jgi:hypothetical protein
MHSESTSNALVRFFSGLTEQTFEAQLGVADPGLIDYIAELLARFSRCDAVYAVRNPAGRPLTQVTEMLVEAEARFGPARREVHRHIGDYTLFWTGVYPEALPRLQGGNSADALFDLGALGKRAYLIASTIPDDENPDRTDVLERLSHDFELCQYGLRELRREWERRDGDGELPKPFLIN